ncbi:MAG: SulP family inorganic anion transporter [Deltaproteobacteria bacterium]|nr:SulP family inorganic anion transporter [Deltaproteobacteria bacterium]
MGPFQSLRADLPAGIVVFFVAVPLCLGIALASGAPLFSGLIAGIIGGIVVGAVSGSALGVSGPAAGLAVIVYGAIQSLGRFDVFLLAVVLAGLMQIGLGFARAGILAYFFPSAVIKGMLSGIGLLIILKQIPHAVGWDADFEGDESFVQADGETTFTEIVRAFDRLEPSAVLVAGIGLAILIGWERWLAPRGRLFRLIQGPLVAVAFGIAYQIGTSRFAPAWALADIHRVKLPVLDAPSQIFSLLTLPDFSQIANPTVWVVAATIAVVASLETLLCVEATDKLDPEKRITPTNRELVAQGIGNAVAGAIGGLPITQVIVRSSANIQSGGRTKVSAIFHGLLLLVAVVVAAELLNQVPLAVLASILLVVGYKLAKPALFAAMWRQGPGQFVPFVVTIVAILATDLLTGVLTGLAIGVGNILYRSYQNTLWIESETHDDGRGRTVRLRLAEQVSFLGRGALLKQLASIPDGSHVVLDLSRSVVIDHDVVEILEDFERSAPARGIDVRREPRGATLKDEEAIQPEEEPIRCAPTPPKPATA